MKNNFSEYYTSAEYDAELEKILAIDQPRFAVLFYHAVSKALFEMKEETLSEASYFLLCDYLLDNLAKLTADLRVMLKEEDLKTGTCSLAVRANGEVFKPGVHYFDAADYYLKALEDTMLDGFVVETWEANASTN